MDFLYKTILFPKNPTFEYRRVKGVWQKRKKGEKQFKVADANAQKVLSNEYKNKSFLFFYSNTVKIGAVAIALIGATMFLKEKNNKMLYTDFCNEFNQSVERGDVNSAQRALMQELGRVLVRSKQDFVDLLKESGYEAEITDSDIDLVNTFVENVDSSPSLMLGASMLIASQNRQASFDGEDEYLNDDLVKDSYNVMVSYFNGEKQSNAVGAIVGGTLGLASAGVGLGKGLAESKERKQQVGQKALEQKQASRQQIIGGILQAKQQQAEATKQKQAESAKNKRIAYIVGGLVLGILAIGTIIYFAKRKR